MGDDSEDRLLTLIRKGDGGGRFFHLACCSR